MKNEKSERKFDFRPMGLAIKKAREKKGMTQEQLADIIGRDTRTVMYHENDGQHPSLDIFYQLHACRKTNGTTGNTPHRALAVSVNKQAPHKADRNCA